MREERPQIAVSREPTPYPRGSRAEYLADVVVHIAGIAAALMAAPVIITLAAIWFGDASTVGAAAVYGVSLIATLVLSGCYHMARHGRARQILRRLDHAAIYVKIAATYTPFAVLLAGDSTMAILTGIWGAAFVGVGLKMVSARRWQGMTLALYFAMGWAVVVIGGPILQEISTATFVLMLLGGGLYSVGVVILYWERLRFRNAIWHGFVLAASFAFYTAILVEVTRHVPGG